MCVKLTQDHMVILANLTTANQLDRAVFIMLTTTNATLTQQLINVSLKLTKALTVVQTLTFILDYTGKCQQMEKMYI